MRTYHKVVNFKYDNKMYTMFIDNRDKYYFLENNNDKYSVIDGKLLLKFCFLFSNPPHIMNISSENKKGKKILPKILIGGMILPLTFATACTVLAGKVFHDMNVAEKEAHKNFVTYMEEHNVYNEDGNQYKLTFDIEDSSDELVVETYTHNDNLKSTYIYDMDYLGMLLDYKTVGLDDFYNIIDSNNNISPKFKPLVKDFCKAFVEKHPNAERRVLYENLKTLDIKEVNKMDLLYATMSSDASACYVRSENRIYVLEGCEYKKETWDYQVIFHELSHCARTGMWDKDGYRRRVQCEGLNFYTTTCAEALNSIFAVSLFDYEEKDIAYQLQSNYFVVMLSSMDNYEITDYMNKPLSYFAKKLDEFHGDNNYATCMLELLETQFNDFHSSKIDIAQEEYYPLYAYISDIYYKNRIKSGMSYEEARAVTDKMLDILLFDVPEEYNIDVNYFYTYLNEYCQKLGIEIHESMIRR